VLVSEQLLDLAQVRAGPEQLCSEDMAQGMRCDRLALVDSCRCRVAAKRQSHRRRRQALSVYAKKRGPDRPSLGELKNMPRTAARVQGGSTLRRWVASVKDCSIGGGLVRDGRVVRIGRLVRDGEVIAEGREVNIPLDRTPDAARDVPGRGRGAGPARKLSPSPGSTRVVFVQRDDIPGWP
jgi:hypothetical protein